MKVFKLEGEGEEAVVIIDRKEGNFEFKGRFMPQKTKEFFQPVFDTITEYVMKPCKKTTLSFKLDYFNTASSKKILDIFIIFEQIQSKNQEVVVNWYSSESDSDILDAGKGYSELVKLPFNFLTF